jgi:hypothetical protein
MVSVALSLTFDEMPEMVARWAAIHELRVPPLDRRAVVGLLDRMGLQDRRSGFTWEKHLHWLTTGDERTTVAINELSGGLRYRLRPLADEPGRDVTTAASRLEEIARGFLEELGRPGEPLALDRITYLRAQSAARDGSPLTRSTLDAGLIFTRTVDELPVVGPGGMAMVKIGTDETVVGGREIWRRIVRRGEKLKLRTPDESIELLRSRLAASGANGEVHVRKARQGYSELGIEEAQSSLEPCYAFVIETVGGLVDSKKVEVIPAAVSEPTTV